MDGAPSTKPGSGRHSRPYNNNTIPAQRGDRAANAAGIFGNVTKEFGVDPVQKSVRSLRGGGALRGWGAHILLQSMTAEISNC